MSGIIGVPKKDMSVTNSDYINFSLVDYSQEELQKDFKIWLKDESYFKDYNKVSLVKEGDLLIRLYRYTQQRELLDPLTGEKIKQVKILPVVKVIKSNSPSFNVGDICSISENIAEIATNPMWLQWHKLMTDSRPIPEGLPEPDKQVGLILDWRKGYQFTLDKLEPTEDDRYTFIIPFSQIRAILKP